MIVQLESGLWILKGEHKLATSILEDAQEFDTIDEALIALAVARKWKPYEGAVIDGGFNGAYQTFNM